MSSQTREGKLPVQKFSVGKYLANVISLLFHPGFMIMYYLLILLLVNPYLFSIQDSKGLGLIVIYTFILSVIFPTIPVVMMSMLGFSNGIQLEKRNERTIPIAITGVFYLWLYINMLNNHLIPIAFSFFILGSVITLFSCFFVNLFSKISLHTAGIGGLVTGLAIMKTHFAYAYFGFNIGNDHIYQVNTNILVVLFLVIAGIVGTSRLYLKAHSSQEVFGGYMVGILAQLIAMRILLY